MMEINQITPSAQKLATLYKTDAPPSSTAAESNTTGETTTVTPDYEVNISREAQALNARQEEEITTPSNTETPPTQQPAPAPETSLGYGAKYE